MTKAERTRQFIIEKSAPIFNTKGIAGTAMSDIMEATQLAKGSLYVHFENKEELSYCAVDYIFSRLAGNTAAELGRHTTSKAKLLALVDFLSNPAHAPVAGSCPILNFTTEADDTNPVILDKVRKMINSTLKTISTVVETGIAKGEFKKSFNAKEFATKTFALIEGGILISRAAGHGRQMSVITNMIKREIEEMSG